MKDYICMNCGTVGGVKRIAKGHFLLEVFLWLFFLIPGFFYSAWRLFNKENICKCCGSNAVVLKNSQAGQNTIKKFDYENRKK